MTNKHYTTLEFNKIIDMLCACAVSDCAKEKLAALTPYLSEGEVRRRMQETTDGKKILESFGNPPLSVMKELDKILLLAEKGSMLLPEQLTSVGQFISSCRRMKGYLKKADLLHIDVACYGSSLYELSELYEEIDRSIRNDTVDDSASPALRDIRRKIDSFGLQIKSKLDSLIKANKAYLVDGYVAMRQGRYTLPVKREYKHQLPGSVIDTSGSGGTYFIEPTAIRRLQEELSLLQIEEENEVRKILYTLTVLVCEAQQQLHINMEGMETLDIIFSKAKLSLQMKGIPVPVDTERRIIIKSGRHPLLVQESTVPLNFTIGNGVSGVIITGPNTGGKTVALKTVGLLSLMAQSGLHIPAEEGSMLCMHSQILCDIGDGQSIAENLSTFSSHMTGIIEILRQANGESLVLLDELGSGTDPAEGMGLAVAILDELKRKACLLVATTHYPQIKDFARETAGFVNARMTFDKETLAPLYSLEIGEAGESCALYIAMRLGLPKPLLERARDAAYGRQKDTIHTHNPLPTFEKAIEVTSTVPSSVGKVIREEQKPEIKQPRAEKFNIGDSVTVYPQKEIGLVFQRADEKGIMGVQIKGKKQFINHKRIKLRVPASELYPPDYDFSIVFDSVENRKARHILEKRHDPNIVIQIEDSKS